MPADSEICLGEALQLQKLSVILCLLSRYHDSGYHLMQVLDTVSYFLLVQIGSSFAQLYFSLVFT